MTEYIEYFHTHLDKGKWGSGPWVTEPDKIQFEDLATGLPCLIVRNELGALCGYVGVELGHPFHGKDYNDCPAHAHGGLTFASGCSHGADPARGICHVPAAGRSDDVWWFGFDCAHSSDVTPAMANYFEWPDSSYRDVAYVKNEIRELAQRLKELS